jgi:hypothetical protein
MLSILTCFLWVGLAFVGFGDDVMIGASELNDVALKDQSLRKKGKLLETITESTDPDIIIGTETRWLNPTFRSSEIFPDYYLYDIERRDRPKDPHGEVLSLAFVGFGDDVMIGASELNDVALKDGELMLDPDVDGIDASLMLSTAN